MQKNFRPTRMEVNLNNLRANYSAIRSYVGNKKIYAVIKADAYGHGASRVAYALLDEGCENFAVAIPEEAFSLREDGIKSTILLLGSPPYSAADEIARQDITAACTDVKFAEALSIAAQKQNKTAKIHIKIDSGLGRTGFSPDEMEKALEKILSLPSVEVEGVFTHFATADEESPDWTNHQFSEYKKTLAFLQARGLSPKIRHACNSAGILAHPDKYLDAVRPGIVLYGMMPSARPVCANPIKLLPTFEVKTAVALVRELKPCTGISYGLRYMTRGDERIAVLPIGYSDGYTRALSMKMTVLIHGEHCPLIGSICMDQMMVNISRLDNVQVGDEVVLIGKQCENIITPEEIAEARDTINYEIPVMFSKRVPRIYVTI